MLVFICFSYSVIQKQMIKILKQNKKMNIIISLLHFSFN